MTTKRPYIDRAACRQELPCTAAEHCPAGALHAPKTVKGKKRGPDIDFEKCNLCGICALTCKSTAVKMV